MSKAVHKSVEKTAKKVSNSPVAKPKSPLASITQTLTATKAAPTAAQAKAERDAERAKRYPAAAKAEAAKGKPVAGGKPAEKITKVAKPQVEFKARVYKAGQTMHAIAATGRPSSGPRLFAHTFAVLSVLGMFDSKRIAVPKTQLMTLLGDRAVSYHLKDTTNFEDAPKNGIRLSIKGRNHFTDRGVDNQIANAFVSLLLDGKVSAETGVAEGNVYATRF